MDIRPYQAADFGAHRGWLYAVAVSESCRGRGIRAAFVQTAEAALRDLGCSKVNLQVRGTNTAVIAFQKRLGLGVEDRVSMGLRLR